MRLYEHFFFWQIIICISFYYSKNVSDLFESYNNFRKHHITIEIQKNSREGVFYLDAKNYADLINFSTLVLWGLDTSGFPRVVRLKPRILGGVIWIHVISLSLSLSINSQASLLDSFGLKGLTGGSKDSNINIIIKIKLTPYITIYSFDKYKLVLLSITHNIYHICLKILTNVYSISVDRTSISNSTRKDSLKFLI